MMPHTRKRQQMNGWQLKVTEKQKLKRKKTNRCRRAAKDPTMMAVDMDTTSIVKTGGSSHACFFSFFSSPSSSIVWTHTLLLCSLCRGRSPQPPAEEDEEDFDENLVAIDTCE